MARAILMYDLCDPVLSKTLNNQKSAPHSAPKQLVLTKNDTGSPASRLQGLQGIAGIPGLQGNAVVISPKLSRESSLKKNNVDIDSKTANEGIMKKQVSMIGSISVFF